MVALEKRLIAAHAPAPEPGGWGGGGGGGGEKEEEGVSTLPVTSKSVRGVPLSQEGRRVLDCLMGALEDVWDQELPRFGDCCGREGGGGL